MRQSRIVACGVVVGFGVIALACCLYLVFEPTGALDGFIWGPSSLLGEAGQCLEHDDLDGALTYANRAVRCGPESWFTYYERAGILEARGDFHEAIKDYTKAGSLGYPVALADRGRVYEKIGETEKALASYCEVLKIRAGPPSDVRSVAQHRLMQRGEDDWRRYSSTVPSLLRFFDESIERHPDNEDLKECRELILRSEQE